MTMTTEARRALIKRALAEAIPDKGKPTEQMMAKIVCEAIVDELFDATGALRSIAASLEKIAGKP